MVDQTKEICDKCGEERLARNMAKHKASFECRRIARQKELEEDASLIGLHHTHELAKMAMVGDVDGSKIFSFDYTAYVPKEVFNMYEMWSGNKRVKKMNETRYADMTFTEFLNKVGYSLKSNGNK